MFSCACSYRALKLFIMCPSPRAIGFALHCICCCNIYYRTICSRDLEYDATLNIEPPLLAHHGKAVHVQYLKMPKRKAKAGTAASSKRTKSSQPLRGSFSPYPPSKSYRLLEAGPVVLVVTKHDEKPN